MDLRDLDTRKAIGYTLIADRSMTEADLYAFMAKHRLGILGTTCHTDTPQSALVGIAITPQLEIIFDTVKSSRKYPNLIARPACSFVIGGWGAGEQTVQYEGQAEELKSPALERYQEIYFKAWPDGPARMSWPGIVYFVVRPTWIRYSDFDQDPPLIHEFTLRSARPNREC
jgi:pyridoxamine 5'-phosphate oxidase-like protein